MRYREVGRTGITVSEIGFGAWSVGTNWWAENSRETEKEMIRAAVDAGINFFDTSNVYGEGESERILGSLLKERREEVVLSTKFGYVIDAPRSGGRHSERPQRFEAKFLRYSLEASLRNLQTDHVEILQLHNPKMDAIMDDALFEALEELREDNVIYSYGVALGPAIGWLEEGLRAIETRDIATVQTVYNVLEQEPGRTLFERASERGISGLVRVPHASGALDERFRLTDKLREDDHRNYRMRKWLEDMHPFSEEVSALASAIGMTLSQFAVAFALADDAVASVLPTFTSSEDVKLFTSVEEMPPLGAGDVSRAVSIYARARAMLQEGDGIPGS